MTSILFIGGGNMASCLIGGMLSKGFDSAQITVSEPNPEARKTLEQSFGISTTDENREAAERADLIVLAVKPQVMRDVATQLAPALSHSPLVVSIAAGMPVSALREWLGENPAIVRAMPNTPALVQAGATGLYATTEVSEAQKQLVEKIFAAVGIAFWVGSEQLIDAVTALSGSGPAYFFLFMEIMQMVGEEMGLDSAVASALTTQTALGAALMAQQGSATAAELRSNVTSPGGTTERAINEFQQSRLEEVVRRAMTSALHRAEEMAQDFSS